MEFAKVNPTGYPMEIEVGTSTQSFQRFLESQAELFQSQVDQLQKIVTTQCKLTGVNPLSQEMAAGALSVKIGKRPRDLLNPKAVKYMQSVFSIKDTISKKETREISALCGVTVTQVREFFAGQRSRMRRLVHVSREKATRLNACKTSPDVSSTQSSHSMPLNDQVPANTMDPKNVEEGPSCSSLQEETIPGLDSTDKNFLENIFSLMKKEETFTGQVKLMEWVLQIHNSAVLSWFLTKGGIMILASWLSQAAAEEQTTVLLVIFKVLSHLPLHKALPVHMSAILQTVNRLRFYRTSDISNRAKGLLSRWSKLFERSQSLKKPSSANSSSDAQKEIIRRQRINEILSDKSWQSKIDIPEDIFALGTDNSESSRKPESAQMTKPSPSPNDESSKKQVRIVSSPQARERRKVLLVEQPGRRTAGRSPQVARAAPASQGRPMSADDIQKAKMRAIFMQSKYGKGGAPLSSACPEKIDYPKASPASNASNALLPSKSSQPKKEEDKSSAGANNTLLATKPFRRRKEEDVCASVKSFQTKKDVCSSGTGDQQLVSKIFQSDKQENKESFIVSLTQLEDSKKTELGLVSQEELLWEKLKRDRIPWKMPPELKVNPAWSVAAGGNSREVEVQIERVRREKEIFYWNTSDIPSDPKEPWDVEMGFDDTLTPEIPTEQPPDADVAVSPRINSDNSAGTSASAPAQFTNGNSEPDMELLAVLLKNPQLVLALTSGQSNNFTGEEMVALLDMLKAGAGGSSAILNGLAGNPMQKPEPVSLPSPTPPSDPVMRWKAEPPSMPQPVLPGNGNSAVSPAANSNLLVAATQLLQKLPEGNSALHQTPKSSLSVPHFEITINPSKQLPPSLSPTMQNLHPLPTTNSLPMQIHPNHTPQPQVQATFPRVQQIYATHSPLLDTPVRPQNYRQIINQKPSSISNPSQERPRNHPSLSMLPTPTSLRLQTVVQSPPLLLSEPPPFPPTYAPWAQNSSGTGISSIPKGITANPNNSNTFLLGPNGPSPGSIHRDRNEFLGEPELESWSPERSPTRSPEFQSSWNFMGPRRDFARNTRSDWSRHRNSGHRDHRQGNRRWRDRDRDRNRDRRY